MFLSDSLVDSSGLLNSSSVSFQCSVVVEFQSACFRVLSLLSHLLQFAANEGYLCISAQFGLPVCITEPAWLVSEILLFRFCPESFYIFCRFFFYCVFLLLISKVPVSCSLYSSFRMYSARLTRLSLSIPVCFLHHLGP